jgi:uncharacterized protein with HEPN domain
LPELPKVISFRNRLAHGYDRVDNALVWEIIEQSLPAFLSAIERLLDGTSEQGGHETI